ncbi:MAG TPA: phosphoribosyltransferase family protein [Nitrososphaerales archaeon]|nr:phosphoribosyltransferase family protein [Nitrososphaerales archaeon]
MGVEDHLEQKVVYSPSSVKYLFIPRTALKKGEHVLIVDDMVRSGITIEALTNLAEKARAKIVGVFCIASMDQSMGKLKSRLGLTCQIESLITLEQKAKHYKF